MSLSTTSNTMSSIRSPLARTIVNKLAQDQMDEIQDHAYWYHVNTSLLDPNISDAFVQSHEDDETKDFCLKSREKSDWIFTEIFHSVVTSVLSWFIHQTSINGLLQRGSMFVFSQAQFEALLSVPRDTRGASGVPRLGKRMIDLGAGDGEVTKKMAPYFDEIYATETSPTMQWRLKEKGFHIVPVESWFETCLQSEDIEGTNAGVDVGSSEKNCGNSIQLSTYDSKVVSDSNDIYHAKDATENKCSDNVETGYVSGGQELTSIKNTDLEAPQISKNVYNDADILCNSGNSNCETAHTAVQIAGSDSTDVETIHVGSEISPSGSTVTETAKADIKLSDLGNSVERVLEVEPKIQFDLISCLNLLDRCSHPLDLLRHIRSAVVPGSGRVLVGVVLPFSPYVEDASAGVEHQPHQRLLVDGSTFEAQVSSLVRDTFLPAGFQLERFTRVPYLCEGDLYQSYYILYDALLLLRPV